MNILKKLYIHIAELLDTSILSIFLGLLTGFVINILTNSINNSYISFAILSCFFTVIFTGILIRIRQKIDLSVKTRVGQANPKEIWEDSSGYDKSDRVNLYLFSLVACIMTFIIFISLYIKGNRIVQQEELRDQKEMTNRLNRIENLEKQNNVFLISLLDSLKVKR